MENRVNSTQKKQAIVIGSGIAGLLAARVLSNYFEKVSVIEQDIVTDTNHLDPRKGVPQGPHSHFLMLKGITIIRKLFPKIDEELAKRGAKKVDIYRDIQLYRGTWLPNFESGRSTFLQSRPVLEDSIRTLLKEDPNIQFLYGKKVEGILTNDNKTRLIGVYTTHKDINQPEKWLGDLIVDATGRNSSFPLWLESIGYPIPQKTEINNDIYYSSRIYQCPEAVKINWKCKNIRQSAPYKKKAGLVMEIEDKENSKQWLVTLTGQLGDYPDNSEEGFLEFARQLEQPDLYHFIKQAIPITPITSFRSPTSYHYHYEDSHSLPEGFIAIGDSFYTFNPVFGQGMSACAIAADRLNEALARYNQASFDKDFQSHYFKNTARILNRPWRQTLNQDLLYPEIKGKRPFGFKLLSWYKGQILQLCNDPVIGKTIYKLINLEESPIALFRPYILLKVLKLTGQQLVQKWMGKKRKR